MIRTLFYMSIATLFWNCTNKIDLSKINEGTLHFVLENGLQVILKKDDSNPLTSIHLRVKTGSIDEVGYFGSGLSHFFEHSLFLGSKGHPEKDSYSAEIERYGGANVNAYTTYDHTAYHFTLLSKYTKEGINCIEDLVFHPLFPKKLVENEMGSIVSEMNMGDDNPDRFFSKFSARVMFKNLPYKFPVIGYKDQFSKLTREELLDYYQKTYIPNNMILSIVGNFDLKEVAKHVHELFGKNTSKPLSPLGFYEDEPWQREFAEMGHPKAQYPRVIFAWQTVSYFDENMFALDVMSGVMGSGPGSILYSRLKEKEKLVENIYSFSWTPKYKGIFEIAVDLSPTQNKIEIADKITKIEEIIQEELQKIKKGKIEDFRLSSVKRSVLTSALKTTESTLGSAGHLAGSVMTADSIHYNEFYLKGIEAVTKTDIKKMVDAYFSSNKMKTIIMVSEKMHKSGKIFANSTIDADIKQTGIRLKENEISRDLTGIKKTAISYRTALEKINHFNSPLTTSKQQLKTKKLKNGLSILHRKETKSPKITIVLNAIGGLQVEKDVPNGSFNLLSQMFLTSNDKYTKEELINLCKEHGISFSPSSGKYSFGINMSFLTDKTKIAANILKSVVLNQHFNQKDFQVEKRDGEFSIEQKQESGWYQSGLHFKKGFFTDTMLENAVEGTKESLSNITIEHLENLKKDFFIPSNMVLSIYGDIEEKELHKYFLNWLIGLPNQTTPPIDDISLPPISTKSKEIKTFYMKGSKQSFFRLGYRAPKIDNKESIAFKVLNGYFSGMGGPLFKLRSEPFIKNGKDLGGRAYQIGAFYDDSLNYGAMIFYAVLRYEAKDEYRWALTSFLKEIDKLKGGQFDQEVFERAKLSVIGRELNAGQSLENRAYNENLYELYGLGADKYEQSKAALQDISKEDIIHLANKYLSETNFLANILLPN